MCVILYVLYGGFYCPRLVIGVIVFGGVPARLYILWRNIVTWNLSLILA
jgi:hypothetical protein